MPRGRPPQGQLALSGAERQARWRVRHAGAPVSRWRRPADRRSRPQRWRDAVAELVALQNEYTQWFEALPEPLREPRPARPCKRLSSSISASSPTSIRRAASAATERVPRALAPPSQTVDHAFCAAPFSS